MSSYVYIILRSVTHDCKTSQVFLDSIHIEFIVILECLSRIFPSTVIKMDQFQHEFAVLLDFVSCIRSWTGVFQVGIQLLEITLYCSDDESYIAFEVIIGSSQRLSILLNAMQDISWICPASF
jgi:hypothetical protein